MVILLAMGAWLAAGYALPPRAAASVQRIESGDLGQDAFRAYLTQSLTDCSQPVVTQGVVTARCAGSRVIQETAAYWVLGDSHAEHLMIGLTQAYPQVAFTYVTREGLPLVSNDGFKAQFEQMESASVRGVVLSAHWSSKLQGLDPHLFEQELVQTLERLMKSGKHVVLMDDVPIFPMNAERCAFADRLWATHSCTAAVDTVIKNPIPFLPIVDALKKRYPQLVYIDPSHYLCTEHECTMAQAGQLLYRDRNHLNIPGSQYIGQRLQGQWPELFPP